MTSDFRSLTVRQQTLLNEWLPGASVEKDYSWGLVESTVLKVTHAGSCFIVKAGGSGSHHIARELEAHLRWLGPWISKGRAPALVYADAEAKLLVTRYLPGQLVLGSGHDDDPATYRQAGELLAVFHAQDATTDHDYEATANDKALAWLSGRHRIATATAELLQAQILAWPTPPSSLSPTHGDWQPRNWLIHEHRVSVIDFGRAAMRPPMTDFARLAAQEFRRDPRFEAAFLDGYGSDPREKEAWHRTMVREAIGTAAWAHQVGDERFEAQGNRMIAEVLSTT